MVNITRGQIENPPVTDKLISYFQSLPKVEGNLFLGYPILPSVENKLRMDALLISEKYGIIAFAFYNETVDKDFES